MPPFPGPRAMAPTGLTAGILQQIRHVTTKQKLGSRRPVPVWDMRHPEWSPGPLSESRLREYIDEQVRPDMLLMTYRHEDPGEPRPLRYRPWDNSQPWMRGLPNRPPPGRRPVLPIRDIRNHTNVPEIERVVLQTFVKEALTDETHLLTARACLMMITGLNPTVLRAKSNVAVWKLRRGMPCGARVELTGEAMYRFLSTLSELVLPRIKEFAGLDHGAVDQLGNIGLGMSPQAVALFPEIEAAYDQLPTRIPGFNMTILTTAKTPEEGKLLLSSIIPYKRSAPA